MSILSMHFDGRYIITASADKTCKLFSVRQRLREIQSYVGNEHSVSCARFDSDKVYTGRYSHLTLAWMALCKCFPETKAQCCTFFLVILKALVASCSANTLSSADRKTLHFVFGATSVN
jgi:WD40 repeat protein